MACCLASGDAVIGINPAADNVATVEIYCFICWIVLRIHIRHPLCRLCVLAHVTTQMEALRAWRSGGPGVPIHCGNGGSESSFGINLALLEEAWQAARELHRGTVGDDIMYFETGQGSALSANAHHGIDQQTLRSAGLCCRAEIPSDAGQYGRRIYRAGVSLRWQTDHPAGLEDHFCGKLLGLPMGCDVCYTNHAEADQDDMDVLLTLLGTPA